MPTVNMEVLEESRRHQLIQKYEVYPLNSSDTKDYQIKLSGMASSTKEDARIIQNDILDQWAELKGTVWSKIGILKSKTPQIILGLSGNPSSKNINDGDATFKFFDDFESYAIGTFTANSKWDIYKDLLTDIYISEIGHTKFGYYNGKGSNYAIGAYIPDNEGLNGIKYNNNPIITPEGSGWESDDVKDQFALKINGTYNIWYSGFDGSKWEGLGLATSVDGLSFTKSASNPILSPGAGTYDSGGVSFPSVYYDIDEGDPSKRYKMFYMGKSNTGIYSICYAYSSNGLSWTKYTSNPVVSIGSSGDWDDKWVGVPTNVIKIDSTYYLFYGGKNVTTDKWQTGLVTFTDFEGAYTKSASNPVISRKIQLQSLTAQTNLGSKIITVSDTSGFHVNEPVFVRDTSTGDELNTVQSIDSSTQLTLVTAVTRNYPSSSTIRSWMYGSNSPKTVQYDGSIWKLWATAFQPYTPSDLLRETTYYATSTDGISWTVDYNNSPLLPFGSSGDWDDISTENPSMLIDVKQSSDLTKIINVDSYGTATAARIASVDTLSDFVCEYKIKYEQQRNVWIEFRGQNYNMLNPDGYFALKQLNDHRLGQYNSGWTLGTAQAATLAIDTYYHAIITANGNNQNFKINNYMGSNIIDRTGTYSLFNNGYVGLTSYSSSSADDSHAMIDWIFVREYTTNEPIIQEISTLNRTSLIKYLGSRL